MAFFKRKQLLIIPGFQLSFLRYTVAIAVLVSVTYYGAIKYFFWKFHSLALELKIPADNIFFRFLSEQESMLGGIFFVTTFVISLIIIAHGLFFSIRIAGPIYHIQSLGRMTISMT
jgi:hypothetical protein